MQAVNAFERKTSSPIFVANKGDFLSKAECKTYSTKCAHANPVQILATECIRRKREFLEKFVTYRHNDEMFSICRKELQLNALCQIDKQQTHDTHGDSERKKNQENAMDRDSNRPVSH